MKRIMSCAAIAVLIAAGVPALAQTSTTTNTGTSSDQGATGKGKMHKHSGMKHSRKSSSQDNMAEQLNRQELQNLQGAQSGSTSSGTR